MKNPHDIILRPIVSEKTYARNAAYNAYTFAVDASATKGQIRTAIEAIFEDVKVAKVNTLNRKGKTTRNRRTNTQSSKPTVKHAIVTLSEGEIELFTT